MDKLPNGWELKSISDIATVKGGKRIPKGCTLLENKTDYPYIRVSDFTDKGSIDLSDIKYIDKDVQNQISNYTISSDDLYISIAGTIGKTGIIPKELDGANLTENAAKLVFKNNLKINKWFILYFTQSYDFKEQAGLATRIVAMPKLALSRLSDIKLLLPPLSEQTRIVNRLDSLFERIDKSIALLEENIKHTEALMASVLDEVLTSSKDSIEISKLVIKTENVNPQNNPEVKYTYIDISSVNNKTHIIESPSELQGKDAPSRARKSVVKGDIVFATTRPNLRNIAVIDSDYLNPIASTGFCVLRTNSGASTDFLFLCLLSNSIQEQIKPFIRGAQYPAISDKDLLQCKIPKLNLEEQINVSNKVMKIREKLALLMSEQQSKLSYLKALKASLLDKAFKGEL